jgi:hypothetical protein
MDRLISELLDLPEQVHRGDFVLNLSEGVTAGKAERTLTDYVLTPQLADTFDPTRSNLERHTRPDPRHLLEDGELPGLVPGLEIVRYEEGWTEQGRHEARLVARGLHAGLDRGSHDRTRASNKA